MSEVIEIKNPIKSWWPGDPRVEPYMTPIREALLRCKDMPKQNYTDIYNRAYEAIYKAITDIEQPKTGEGSK